MKWKDIEEAVRTMVENSKLRVDNVNWTELARYLAVVMTQREVYLEGLQHVIPKRRKRSARKVAIRYLRSGKGDEKWLPARKPGCRQQKKMLALAISKGVLACISSHTYRIGDTVYHQQEGGPIGLELTGAVSRPFMML